MERKVYTERELILLATLVKEKGAAIENKRTDSTTLQNKNRAWEQIVQHFNIQPDVNSKRTSQQLRKLWANLKQKKRKQTTQAKYEMLATGRGLPDKKVDDPVLSIVEDAAPYADIEMDSVWDSIAVFESHKSALEESKYDESNHNVTIEPPQGEYMNERIEFVFENDADHTVHWNIPAKRRKCVSSTNLATREKLAKESTLRIQKIREGIIQQKQLHDMRMRAAEEELAVVRIRRECEEIKLKNLKSQYNIVGPMPKP